MPLPTDPILRAAVRWLERLQASGVARSRALFTTHSDLSDITPTQYGAAYNWLVEVGLLDDLNNDRPPNWRVFEAAMGSSDNPWIRDADVHVRTPVELPLDALRAATTLGLTEDDAYALVKTAWGKVDTAERSRIGSTGELVLVDLLRASTAAHVHHVAEWADGYGYDISVEDIGFCVHLEVKTTIRLNRFTAYVSRHEYETMLRDQSWHLVAVRLTSDGEIAATASIPRSWIMEQAPADHAPYGRWESFRLETPMDVLEGGIPSLSPVLADEVPGVLTGSVPWPG